MSRNIKGGFLTLSGVVGIVGMIIAAMQNPATAWVTPPGRMIVSILENGLLIPTVLFLVLFIYGNGDSQISPRSLMLKFWTSAVAAEQILRFGLIDVEMAT